MKLNQGIHLTNEEFFFLSSVFDCRALVGVPDPFIGYWVEEIEAEMKRVARGLLEKGYIIYRENEIQIVPELLEFLVICMKTNVTFWLHSERGSKQHESYYYLDSRKTVESKVFEEGDQLSYVLCDKGPAVHVWKEVLQEMYLEEKPILYGDPFNIPMEVLDELLEEGRDYSIKKIEAVLQEHGVISAMAKALARTLKQYSYYGTFTSFYRMKNVWRIQGLRVLYDSETNWLIRVSQKGDRKDAEIQTASTVSCTKAIKEMLLRSKQSFSTLVKRV